MATLTVGTGKEYGTITAAMAASHSGDTIDVQAGTYINQFLTLTHSITLQAVGGMVSMTETRAPPNDKGMITVGSVGDAPNVTINGFEISGVSIPASLGGDGAAIRYQSGNLTLNDDWFQHNQDGLLPRRWFLIPAPSPSTTASSASTAAAPGKRAASMSA